MPTWPRPQTFTILRRACKLCKYMIVLLFALGFLPEATHMAQTSSYPQGLAKAAVAVGRTSQLAMGVPFDVALETYAKAVRIGFIRDSILAEAKFARSLGTLEKLTLGPWARQV